MERNEISLEDLYYKIQFLDVLFERIYLEGDSIVMIKNFITISDYKSINDLYKDYKISVGMIPVMNNTIKVVFRIYHN